MYPNVNTKKIISLTRDSLAIISPFPLKHPNAHQPACMVNENGGLVEIQQGKFAAALAVPPSPISIKYSTCNSTPGLPSGRNTAVRNDLDSGFPAVFRVYADMNAPPVGFLTRLKEEMRIETRGLL